MTLFTRARLVLKAASRAVQIVFLGRGRGWGWWGPSHVPTDYAKAVGDGSGNSILMAVVLWMCRTFPEAPLRISTVDQKSGEHAPQPAHPLAKLLARPNPYYSGVLMWMATLNDWLLGGNAYWLKERSAAGKVVRLWWLPAWSVEPAWPVDGSAFLSWYEYRPDQSREPIRYQPDDVVHLRYGLDPRNPRKGLSPVASLIRELFTDEEAGSMVAALVKNLGVPGVMLAPDGDYKIQQDDAEAMKEVFEERFGGENRGRPLVLGQPMKVSVLSFNPEQMRLRDMRQIPEERVTAIFGVPAVVVGLGAGLARSTFANFAEARESAAESNLVPTWRLMAEELNTQLVPDFGDPDTLIVDFDLSQVRILQTDQNALHQRTREDLLAGLLTLDEALQEIGRKPLVGGRGEVYFVPNTVTAIHAQDVQPPQGGAPDVLPPGDGSQPSDALLPVDQTLSPNGSGKRRKALTGGKMGPQDEPFGLCRECDSSLLQFERDDLGGICFGCADAERSKRRKALTERVIPAGADEDLGPIPVVTFDVTERRRLASEWRQLMADTPAADLLDAAAANGHTG